jgi:DNA-directed RNA polymerase specialized sigma24 family protein
MGRNAPMPTREQLKAAREGDPASLEALRDYYFPFIHGVVLAYLPHHLAQRVGEEVWHQARSSLPAEPKQVGTHILALARRLAQAAPGAAERKATERERDAGLRWLTAMRSTPAPQREWASLRLVEGIAGDELAQVSGVDAAVVRSELSRAVKAVAIAAGSSGAFSHDAEDYVYDFSGAASELVASWELFLPGLRAADPGLATEIWVPLSPAAAEGTPFDGTPLETDTLPLESARLQLLPEIAGSPTVETRQAVLNTVAVKRPTQAIWPWLLLGLLLGIGLTWLLVRGL